MPRAGEEQSQNERERKECYEATGKGMEAEEWNRWAHLSSVKHVFVLPLIMWLILIFAFIVSTFDSHELRCGPPDTCSLLAAATTLLVASATAESNVSAAAAMTVAKAQADTSAWLRHRGHDHEHARHGEKDRLLLGQNKGKCSC